MSINQIGVEVTDGTTLTQEFDYKTKFGYHDYNKAFETIPDETSHLDGELARLQESFKSGQTRSLLARIKALKSLHAGITEMKDELCQALEYDMGRGPFYAYLSEIHLILTEIENCIENLRTWMKEIPVETPVVVGPGRSYVKAEPLGVILILGAWNYPVYTLLGPASQAIAAGNCIIFKPSEVSPRCCQALNKLVNNHLDSRFFKSVLGKVKVASHLTTLKFDKIVFTGQHLKAKLIAEQAAKNLVPCLFELGGKCPVIIDESANAHLAAKKVLFGKMPNIGQVCISPDYVMCHESKVEEFLKAIKYEILHGYDDCKTTADSGKMVNEFHYRRVCDLLKDHGG